MKIVVKEIYLDKDIKEAFSIRGKVFVEGMNIPVEIELDKYDKVAHQIIAYADEIPAGTARWTPRSGPAGCTARRPAPR